MNPDIKAALEASTTFRGVGHSFVSSEEETVFAVTRSRLGKILSEADMPPFYGTWEDAEARGLRHYTKVLMALESLPADSG
jgi:hypothetical protein